MMTQPALTQSAEKRWHSGLLMCIDHLTTSASGTGARDRPGLSDNRESRSTKKTYVPRQAQSVTTCHASMTLSPTLSPGFLSLMKVYSGLPL